eukprot:gnl/MRDRNA2_/MRDRNA2_61485_c0_seq1.p1 gnl/MRDRNA2_/MRDRNA2_61485_c0~~gnl/MRDRNA2_/MRDRNA2_61485_c0_seq1.p1  ORF type:complete len:388 (-),score=61.47 gnl/MRDRNA2_/MRDRNA2_61485_c0_seq1:43-1206(-)
MSQPDITKEHVEKLRQERAALLSGALHRVTNEPLQCRAAVVLAGMPRTGSKLQGAFVSVALSLLGITDVSDLGYWDLPKHDPAAFKSQRDIAYWYDDEMHQWGRWKQSTVVIYHSHGFEPALLRLCPKSIVFLTHRCLEDELRSAVMRGWLPVSPQVFEDALRNWWSHYRQWKMYGALDLDYDWMQNQKMVALRFTIDYLTLKLRCQGVDVSSSQLYEAFMHQQELSKQRSSKLHDRFKLLNSREDSGPVPAVPNMFIFQDALVEARSRLKGYDAASFLNLHWCMANTSEDAIPDPSNISQFRWDFSRSYCKAGIPPVSSDFVESSLPPGGHQRMCCARECTVCGGLGCDSGGMGSKCCGQTILASGKVCNTAEGPPPCMYPADWRL